MRRGLVSRGWKRPSRIGEQLELELAGPGRAWLEPWEGRDPRGLTKTAKKFSLRAPPTGGLHADEKLSAESERVSCLQLALPFGFDKEDDHGSR